jgi:hypothetical protein
MRIIKQSVDRFFTRNMRVVGKIELLKSRLAASAAGRCKRNEEREDQ